MFVTGAVNLPFFAGMTFLIAVPTGVKFFNWIGTMWGGSVSLDTPMLWSVGFLVTFLFGGLTGVILASPPLDFHVSDSYFVVAHFHYVVFGTVVFAMFAGFYFWWPKMTGRMLDERLGKIHFWLLFVGFHMTFLIQHWLGVVGMPRRYADYLPSDGWTTLNQISTVGAFLLASSTLPFLWNVYKSAHGPLVHVDDPWGWGRSLEWATSCPPPRHNFVTIPRIRSESPAFDLHHPRSRRSSSRTTRRCARDGEDDGLQDAPATEGRAGLLRENLEAQGKDVAEPNTDRRTRTRRTSTEMKAEAWIFALCTVFLVLVSPSLLVDHRRLDGDVRAHHDHAADPDDDHLPRVPRQEHGAAPGGPQGRRDRRRRRRARVLPAVQLVAAVVRRLPRRGRARRGLRLVAVHHRCRARARSR